MLKHTRAISDDQMTPIGTAIAAFRHVLEIFFQRRHKDFELEYLERFLGAQGSNCRLIMNLINSVDISFRNTLKSHVTERP